MQARPGAHGDGSYIKLYQNPPEDVDIMKESTWTLYLHYEIQNNRSS